MKKDLRLKRLFMLADIWVKLYLFHPGIVGRDMGSGWKRVLLETISELEKAADTPLIVSVLNNRLFKCLNDPLTFARQKPSPDPLNRKSGAEVGFVVSGEMSPVVRIGPRMIHSKSLPNHLDRLSASLQGKTCIIIDLRWDIPYDRKLPHLFFRFFNDSSGLVMPEIKRVHHGWNEDGKPYIYGQTWEISHETWPDPLLKTGNLRRIPVVFIINNSSVLHFRQQLIALQTRPRIRVIWEQTGPFSIPGSKAITYGKDMEVHLNTLLPEFQPDLILSAPIPSHELPALAKRVLEDKSKLAPPLFSHEMRFPKPDPLSHAMLSREERLMGLFKTWGIQGHFSPFINRGKWDTVLCEWISKVEEAPDLKSYYRVLSEFTVQLHDSHVQIRHPVIEKSAALPLRLKCAEGKVIIGEVTGVPAISVGDEILKINGKPIDALEKQWRTRISASSDQAFKRDFLRLLAAGEKGESVKLTVQNSGRIKEIDLAFMEAPEKTEESDSRGTNNFFPMPRAAEHIRLLENNLGYMTPFTMPDADVLGDAFDILKETDGLVIDLRGYPKTHFQQELMRYLCRETVHSPRYEIPLEKDPDSGTRRWSVVQYTVKPDKKKMVYDKPVVALIDETTQSSAEDFCMYLKIADRAVFVGSPTAGCHGNMAFIDLPGGAWLSFTGMRVTWPDGSPFQGIGIIPHVSVSATIRGLREGRDEILEKGIRALKMCVPCASLNPPYGGPADFKRTYFR